MCLGWKKNNKLFLKIFQYWKYMRFLIPYINVYVLVSLIWIKCYQVIHKSRVLGITMCMFICASDKCTKAYSLFAKYYETQKVL